MRQAKRGNSGSTVKLCVSVGILVLMAATGCAGETSQSTRPAETAEAFATRFLEVVIRDLDRGAALNMLCAEGAVYHEANTDLQIEFWSGEAVTIPPHDFRAVHSITLSPDVAGEWPVTKVWVAFGYTYDFEGKDIDIDMSDGWEIYVTELEDGYCASPWAG